jgi:hypothetical protein
MDVQCKQESTEMHVVGEIDQEPVVWCIGLCVYVRGVSRPVRVRLACTEARVMKVDWYDVGPYSAMRSSEDIRSAARLAQ